MRKILLVIDMQNDFIDGVLGTAEAQAIVPAVRRVIDNFDGEVYFTRDTHGEDYMNTQEGKNFPFHTVYQEAGAGRYPQNLMPKSPAGSSTSPPSAIWPSLTRLPKREVISRR